MPRSYYPGFDVLDERDAWDPHTRAIVLERLEPPPPRCLSRAEATLLRTIVSHLLAEDRDEILAYVLSHFDQRLQGGPGEAQRQPHTPPEAQLLRRGLVAIDAVAKAKHRKPFVECSSQQQFQILAALQKGALPPVPEMAGIPAKELFQKFLGLAVEAYASHPRVWSEIGYAGPAYPRGYYRIERGLRDPWEPPKAAPRQPGAPNGKPSSAPRRRTDAQA